MWCENTWLTTRATFLIFVNILNLRGVFKTESKEAQLIKRKCQAALLPCEEVLTLLLSASQNVFPVQSLDKTNTAQYSAEVITGRMKNTLQHILSPYIGKVTRSD